MFLSDKKSIRADGVGDLYRCADKLARNKIDLAMDFFKMAKDKVGDLMEIDLEKDEAMKENLYWAEVVLDEYMRLKWEV